MPAYNFKERFVAAIKRGEKNQTIRKTSKRAKVGDTAYLYTGLRTKKCRLIGIRVILSVDRVLVYRRSPGCDMIIVDGAVLSDDAASKFANDDGFGSIDEMVNFFDDLYGLPFNGYVHKFAPRGNSNVENA